MGAGAGGLCFTRDDLISYECTGHQLAIHSERVERLMFVSHRDGLPTEVRWGL